ncbi:MAG: excinuclease ABC subunit UvrC [Thermoplasmatota archaeon]
MRTDPATLPDECGVYLFKGKGGKVLYVGKAIDIRARVRSHLKDRKNEKEIRLRGEALSVDWIATGTELEALVLEDTLIKRYKPRYNVRLKDDKSYPYILITDEVFPAIRHVRGLERGRGEFFGPHSDPRAVRRSIRWLRKLFPIRSCRRDLSRPSRPCLEYHLDRCIAPCSGRIDQRDYSLIVDGLRMFLSGKSEEVLSRLDKDMWKASASEEYERAAMIRNILNGLRKVRESQKVVLIKGGDVDAVHVDEEGYAATVVKVREGRVVDAVSFSLEGEDSLMGPTEDFLNSFYAISGYIPPSIVLGRMDLETGSREEIQRFLSEKRGGKVRIVRARGEERRSLIDMAARNLKLYKAERSKEAHSEDAIKLLERNLGLAKVPAVIEGFDISHLGGTGTVASMVQFRQGKPRKSGYRRFRIRTAKNDDYASMKEVVGRRYRRLIDQDGEMPDLILIDGGKGQLNAALEALEELGMTAPPDIISLAKREEEVFLPLRSLPIVLKRTDPSLRLLQSIRDEAHRFALTYQRSLRKEDMTILTQVEGVGNARARKLLTCFDSLDSILDAGVEGISSKCSISISLGDRIIRFLREELGR